MGVLDKFLNVMKLNDDDDFDDDDFFDEEEDDFEEVRPKRRLFKKLEEDEDDFEDEDDPVPAPKRTKPVRSAQPARQPVSQKVTPMRSNNRRQNSSAGMEVCVIKPGSMEDTREITETLLSNRTVVLNLEGIDIEVAQRIIDFTSGSCYAINGSLQKISNYIFIVTPASVDISGDFQEIINGAFDVPSINSGY